MEPKIILVDGYCATGKSTFSNKLAEELKIPCFNKDTLKEVLGQGFGPESGEVYQKGSAVTFMLLLHIAERFLQAGRICILESNFRPGELEQIRELLEKYHGQCLTFLFKGDLDVLFERYLARDRSGQRHWVHKSAGADKEAFQKGQLHLGTVSIGQTVHVDATSFDDVNYEELFAEARTFAG